MRESKRQRYTKACIKVRVSDAYDEFSPAARAAALLGAAEAHIEGQHVVSRVVLKNFEGPVGGTNKVGVYNMHHGPTRPIGRSRAGLAPNLLRVGTTSAERLWARTENRIEDAVLSARVSGVQAPPIHLAVLRKAMALHFARGKATVELLDGLWDRRGPQLVASIVERNRTLLSAHYRARFGHRPTEPDLRRLVEEYTSDGTHVHQTGAWTRARVEQLLATLNGPDRTPRRMELLRPPSSAAFFIADDPVTTHLHERGEAATATRIGWDRADEIAMPFAPDLAICLVRDEQARPTSSVQVREEHASEERVAQLNFRQVRSARDYLFHDPNRDISEQVRGALGH